LLIYTKLSLELMGAAMNLNAKTHRKNFGQPVA
jgi:hypothetical protein